MLGPSLLAQSLAPQGSPTCCSLGCALPGPRMSSAPCFGAPGDTGWLYLRLISWLPAPAMCMQTARDSINERSPGRRGKAPRVSQFCCVQSCCAGPE